MDVVIRKIADNSIHDKERLILDVTADVDIGNFVVFDTSFSKDGKISNKVRHTYWFPDQKVKKGDVVVLYTRKGKNISEKKDSHTIYFYYWDLDISVWNNDGDCAVLLNCKDWTSKGVK